MVKGVLSAHPIRVLFWPLIARLVVPYPIAPHTQPPSYPRWSISRIHKGQTYLPTSVATSDSTLHKRHHDEELGGPYVSPALRKNSM